MDMFEQLTAPRDTNETVELTIVQQEKPVFYIHFNLNDLRIQSISANPTPVEGQRAIEIDNELGLKFMTGEENPINWQIDYIDRTYVLKAVDRTPIKAARVDIGMGIYKVLANNWDDIRLQINEEDGYVDIFYDGEKLIEYGKPVKMYFTREDDMTYLKCAFSLDVNSLSAIQQNNQLDEWPNPVRLKLDSVDDLSVYAVKGPLTVSIQNV